MEGLASLSAQLGADELDAESCQTFLTSSPGSSEHQLDVADATLESLLDAINIVQACSDEEDDALDGNSPVAAGIHVKRIGAVAYSALCSSPDFNGELRAFAHSDFAAQD